MSIPLKTLSTLLALVNTSAIVASTTAEARDYRHYNGRTTYSYRTVNQARNVTRYRDVNTTRYVPQVHRVVTVTRVRPVTRVNVVTRVHNRTKVISSNRYSTVRENLRPRYTTSGKTVYLASGGGARSTTSYRYRTVQKVNNVTRYRDVQRVNYVRHINNHVSVVRIRPVIHTHVITRVHERTVVVPKVIHVTRTEYLPGRTYTTAKVIQVHGGTTWRPNYR
jgi:hypothetical protein